MAYAVIKTGGKQYVVEEGGTVRVPSIAAEAGASVELSGLLSEKNGEATLGDTKISAKVVEHGRGEKLVVFKKKRRKHYKRKQGHRQGFTTLKIESIG